MRRLRKLLNIRYALIELVLITLGVSIAFVVQNWNDKMKDNELEKKMLRELFITLNDDIHELEGDIEYNKSVVNAIDSILILIKKDVPYHQSIDTVIALAFQSLMFHPNRSSYETLKNFGINLIRSDSLRVELTNLYERTYQFKNYVMEYEDSYWIKASASFITQNFEEYNYVAMTPNDFESLKKSKEFKTLLRTNSNFRSTDRILSSRSLKSAKKVAKSIEVYLSAN